jgi:hypothetical protein
MEALADGAGAATWAQIQPGGMLARVVLHLCDFLSQRTTGEDDEEAEDGENADANSESEDAPAATMLLPHGMALSP